MLVIDFLSVLKYKRVPFKNERRKDLSVAHEHSHFTDLLDFATHQESHELVTMGAAKIPTLGCHLFRVFVCSVIENALIDARSL